MADELKAELVSDVEDRQATSKGRRFFNLAGIAYCGGCGNKMAYHTSIAKGRMYPYYKCRRVLRDGKEARPCGRSRQNHRAEKLEQKVWDFVSNLMMNPEQLRKDLERMIVLERMEQRGDPDREAKAWSEKLAEADRMRSGYPDLAAKGLMGYEELAEKLEQLNKTREKAERELETLYNRR